MFALVRSFRLGFGVLLFDFGVLEFGDDLLVSFGFYGVCLMIIVLCVASCFVCLMF